jgi:RecB family exonuclease
VPAALRRLEAERLAALLLEWLAMEEQRPPFEVECLEMWHRENLGQLTIQTRIDRIDRLPGHGRVILDYKTGRPAVRDWLGERPVEPQLPLYSLGRGKGELAAVAFARVRRGACAFLGLAGTADLVPGVALVDERHVPDASQDNWQELLQCWRASLQRLAREFAAGEARVDPVNPSQACDRCDLQALCRIAEQHLTPVPEDMP